MMNASLSFRRRFQQDDAHIFCREDQIKNEAGFLETAFRYFSIGLQWIPSLLHEVTAALAFVFNIYELFGFEFSLAPETLD